MQMIRTLLDLVILLVLPPVLLGVIVKTKALFAGRVGAPLLQPWRDVWKLLRKGMVLSRTTTPVFLLGPAVTLAAVLLAGSTVPLVGGTAPIHFAGDAFLFVGLLALGRFLTVVAALDTGSAFEGMGGAREATFACLAEPALLLAFLALSRVTGSIELSGMFGPALAAAWGHAAPSLVLVLAGLFLVVLLENCRVPFDDPSTHLELTMIHEVMVLDHGGPAFGAILYGAAVKLLLFAGLVARIALPVRAENLGLDFVVAVAGLVAVAFAIGVVESAMARLRLLHVPNLLIGACLLSGLGYFLL